jgi:predicted ATP-grasp superfamily ATP-dependent carboligase
MEGKLEICNTMNLLVYEHLCALEPQLAADDPLRALLPEGRAMRDAVMADFRAVPGVNLVQWTNAGWADVLPMCNAVLLIAPESDGILIRLAEMVMAAGVRLLGPTPEAIRLCSDKLALAQHWGNRGVPTPITTLADVAPTSYPVVVKPRDGAGSCDTVLCRNAEDFRAARKPNSIVQPYHSGIAASVAFIDGTPMPACLQVQSSDGRFQYLGGECPIDKKLAKRALRIAIRAFMGMQGLNGYCGVDLLLGKEDMAIEINPRLTTSYIGLRAILRYNLAGMMIGQMLPYAMPRKYVVTRFSKSGEIASL